MQTPGKTDSNPDDKKKKLLDQVKQLNDLKKKKMDSMDKRNSIANDIIKKEQLKMHEDKMKQLDRDKQETIEFLKNKQNGQQKRRSLLPDALNAKQLLIDKYKQINDYKNNKIEQFKKKDNPTLVNNTKNTTSSTLADTMISTIDNNNISNEIELPNKVVDNIPTVNKNNMINENTNSSTVDSIVSTINANHIINENLVNLGNIVDASGNNESTHCVTSYLDNLKLNISDDVALLIESGNKSQTEETQKTKYKTAKDAKDEIDRLKSLKKEMLKKRNQKNTQNKKELNNTPPQISLKSDEQTGEPNNPPIDGRDSQHKLPEQDKPTHEDNPPKLAISDDVLPIKNGNIDMLDRGNLTNVSCFGFIGTLLIDELINENLIVSVSSYESNSSISDVVIIKKSETNIGEPDNKK